MTSAARTSDVLARIKPGLTGSSTIVVGPEHTAPFVGSGRIAVLATPVMINVIEAAALAAIEHLLPAGHQKSRHPSRRQPHRGDPGRLASDRDGRGGAARRPDGNVPRRGPRRFRIDWRRQSSARGCQRGAVRRTGAAQIAWHITPRQCDAAQDNTALTADRDPQRRPENQPTPNSTTAATRAA